MGEYIEYFTMEDLTDILLKKLNKDDEFYEYEYEEKRETCKLLYEAFNHSFHTLLPLLGDNDKDNLIATVYAFNRTREILLREESLLFFNNLLHQYFFDKEKEDADGNPTVSLRDYIQDEEKLGRIFSVCATAYAWNIEYWEMRSKGIDSEEKNKRRTKKLEDDYLMYEDKDRFLKYYKIGNPKDNKSYKEIVFKPGLTKLLAGNPYKKEILQELKNKIYTPYTPH